MFGMNHNEHCSWLAQGLGCHNHINTKYGSPFRQIDQFTDYNVMHCQQAHKKVNEKPKA